MKSVLNNPFKKQYNLRFKDFIGVIFVGLVTTILLFMDVNIKGLNTISLIAISSTWVFFMFIITSLIATKKYYKYRKLLYFIISITFITTLIYNLKHYVNLSLTGSEEKLVKTEYLLQALTSTLNFPGGSRGFTFFLFLLLLIWLGSTLSLGRGFCSWVCPVGGLEDGTSGIVKKVLFVIKDKKWLNFPYAILVVVVLLFFGRIVPTEQCNQNCPSRTVFCSATLTFSSFIGFCIILSVLIFIFSIILPLLTKKRTFCSFICPVGKIQSFLSGFVPLKPGVDTKRCEKCNRCIEDCPNFAVNKAFEAVEINNLCTKCMKCIERCPHSAISILVTGSQKSSNSRFEIFFVYPAFLFMVILSGRMIANSVFNILSTIL